MKRSNIGPTRRPLHRRATVAIALVACLTVMACGGDDDAGSATPDDTGDAETTTSTTEAPPATMSPAEAEADISAKTTEFFDLIGAGDFDAAVVLLENGAEYRDELDHCADLVNGVSIEMKTVEITDDTATTTYDIAINGEVVLADSGGTAVYADDAWLVGENTFLSLYDAAKESCTGPPPAA